VIILPTINVAKIIKNPRFAQKFSIFRKSGEYQSGRFIQSENEIQVTGIVTAPSSNDIIQVPEADRVTGVMCFHATQEIYTTRDTGTSDEIIWKNARYRVFRVIPWSDFGYWKAYGVRMVQDGTQ
jgi:hypothetical protein